MTNAAAAPTPARLTAPVTSIVAGALVLGGLWLGPLPLFSRTAFSLHMLLHLGVMVVAAPLLALGLASRITGPRGFGEALGWYLLAGAFELVMVWGWHVPLLHDAAARNGILFGLEQASFLAGGTAIWAAAFSARSREAAGAAAIALFLTFAHMSMFGLVLSLAPKLIYDPAICSGSFGLAPVDDQHLGGVLMLLGGLPYLVATGVQCLRAVAGGADDATA